MEQYRFTEWGPDGEGGAELYDHDPDKNELVNLVDRPEYQELRKRLSGRLRQRIAAANRKPQGVVQIEDYTYRRVPK